MIVSDTKLIKEEHMPRYQKYPKSAWGHTDITDWPIPKRINTKDEIPTEFRHREKLYLVMVTVPRQDKLVAQIFAGDDGKPINPNRLLWWEILIAFIHSEARKEGRPTSAVRRHTS